MAKEGYDIDAGKKQAKTFPSGVITTVISNAKHDVFMLFKT